MCPDFRRGISPVGVCGFQQFFQTERSAGANTELTLGFSGAS